MLQKVQFLAAIIHQPDLLILDEPFSGLDPVSSRLLRDLVREEHRRGATILFSTHVMTQAEEMCEHVVMIHRGRKVLDDSVAGDPPPVRSAHDPVRAARSGGRPGAAPRARRGRAGRTEAAARARIPAGFDIRLVEGSDPGAAIRRITATVTPARIELARPRLEDIFISLVSEGSARRRGSWRRCGTDPRERRHESASAISPRASSSPR